MICLYIHLLQRYEGLHGVLEDLDGKRFSDIGEDLNQGGVDFL